MPLVGPPYDQFFVSCDEMPYQRTGTVYDIKGPRDHVRRHKVVVRYKEMNEVDACLCPGLPRPGTLYTTIPPAGLPYVGYDLLALLSNQKAEQQDGDDWAIWIVTSTYSTDIPTRVSGGNIGSGIGAQASSNSPDQELADIEWDFETVQEVTQRDLNGSAFTNTAYHLFTPSVSIERDYPVLHISRNELSFNFARANLFARSLNDTSFLGVPRGCVMCMPPQSKQRQKGLLWYWRTSYKLKFRCLNDDGNGGGTYFLPKINVLLPYRETVDGAPSNPPVYKYQAYPNKTNMVDEWQPLVLNKGRYRLGGVPGTLEETVDIANGLEGKNNIPIISEYTNQPVNHDVCLDDLGQPCFTTDPTAPIPVWYKQFKTHRYRSFQELLVEGLS